MSAYVCDPEHIKQLAIFAARRRRNGYSNDPNVSPYYLNYHGGQDMSGKPDEEVASYYANVLYFENIRSVSARYPEDSINSLPGPCEKPDVLMVTRGEMLHPVPLTPVDILRMSQCLDYQSCETSDWRTTTAFALLDAIKNAAIRQLPGYEDAVREYYGRESIAEARKQGQEARETSAAYAAFCD